MKIALANNNGFALIDENSLPLISSIKKWYLHSGGYAASWGCAIMMHRLILPTEKGYYVDHINGNRLDNRRANLRVLSAAENSRYRTRVNKNNTSGFRGVFRTEDNTFNAYVFHEGKKINLGTYKTFEEAVGVRIASEIEYGIKFYEE